MQNLLPQYAESLRGIFNMKYMENFGIAFETLRNQTLKAADSFISLNRVCQHVTWESNNDAAVSSAITRMLIDDNEVDKITADAFLKLNMPHFGRGISPIDGLQRLTVDALEYGIRRQITRSFVGVPSHLLHARQAPADRVPPRQHVTDRYVYHSPRRGGRSLVRASVIAEGRGGQQITFISFDEAAMLPDLKYFEGLEIQLNNGSHFMFSGSNVNSGPAQPCTPYNPPLYKHGDRRVTRPRDPFNGSGVGTGGIQVYSSEHELHNFLCDGPDATNHGYTIDDEYNFGFDTRNCMKRLEKRRRKIHKFGVMEFGKRYAKQYRRLYKTDLYDKLVKQFEELHPVPETERRLKQNAKWWTW